MESKAELIFHPVRMRIVQTLLGREFTTREIARAMPDVPPATLYRHLNRLAEGGIVSVVAERRVRGAVEKTYAITLQQAGIPAEEVRNLDRDGHLRTFMTFIAHVIGGFRRYLDQDHFDFVADKVSYGQATIYVDDEELHRLTAEYVAMLQKAMALEPRPGRRARVITSIVVPEPLAGSASRLGPEDTGRPEMGEGKGEDPDDID